MFVFYLSISPALFSRTFFAIERAQYVCSAPVSLNYIFILVMLIIMLSIHEYAIACGL